MKILMPEEIRKAIAGPELGDNYFGKWGILNSEQRLSIKHLLDVLDSADYIIQKQCETIKEQDNEIEQLKKQIEGGKNEKTNL